MSPKCAFGFHKWGDCKCIRCGKPTSEEESRFLSAAEAGDYDAVKARLKEIPRLALCHDSVGNTPLHLAVGRNDVRLTGLLINHHASVNAKNNQGDTSLHLAAQKSQGPIAGMLIAHRANATFKNKHGDTPLLVAARHDNEAVGELLLQTVETDVISSINEATSHGKFGLPKDWSEDRTVLKALGVASTSGSHRMAARLYKIKAAVHRVKAKYKNDRANMFVRLHNERAAAPGGAGGMFRGFAESEHLEAEEESRLAREMDLAVENELALIANVDSSRGKNQP